MSYEKSVSLIAIAFAAIVFAGTAAAVSPSLGDINADGVINVLDVQATIGEVLGAVGHSDDADLDESGGVDVVDVQNMINSALGTGGMFQVVRGQINCQGQCENLWIAGVSRDGHFVRAKVDSETGRFVLRLRTKTAWTLALCRAVRGEDDQWRLRVLATICMRLGDGTESADLPLAGLGRREMNLGLLELVQNRLMARETLQRMLGEIAGRIDAPDANQNGIPDFVEPLLERLRQGAPGVPSGANMQRLQELIRPCVEAWIEAGVQPDLTDENENQIPDFVEPLLLCIRENLSAWLEEHGVTVSQQDVDNLMAHIRAGLHQWMEQIGPRELVDENEDGIPDYIEGYMNRFGQAGPMDSDGDGIPNYAEDNDGDGIPNCDDPDCHMADDDDCDGIPNAYDWDRDNDGIPNYAE